MPVTISLRKWAPASRSASTVAARSLTEDSAPQAAPSSAAAVRRASLWALRPLSGLASGKTNGEMELNGEVHQKPKEGSPMLRTVQFACPLSKAEADALNAESGRVDTDMVVRHYRVYRKQGVWLAPQN